MALQEGLHVGTPPLRYWLNLGDHSASTSNENSLALVLHGIKQFCEVPRSLGSTDF